VILELTAQVHTECNAVNLVIRRIGVDWVRDISRPERTQGANLHGIMSKDIDQRLGRALRVGRLVGPQPAASDGVVVEGDDGVCEDLVSVAALADNEHDVAAASVG